MQPIVFRSLAGLIAAASIVGRAADAGAGGTSDEAISIVQCPAQAPPPSPSVPDIHRSTSRSTLSENAGFSATPSVAAALSATQSPGASVAGRALPRQGGGAAGVTLTTENLAALRDIQTRLKLDRSIFPKIEDPLHPKPVKPSEPIQPEAKPPIRHPETLIIVNPITAGIDGAEIFPTEWSNSQIQAIYKNSPKATQCQNAYDQLNTAISAAKDSKLTLATVLLWVLGQKKDNPSAALPEVKNKLDNYVSACLSKDLPAYLSAEQLNLAVGVIGFTNTDTKCTGLRFAPDKVLTARHCFLGMREADIRSGWFQYKSAKSPQTRFAACGISHADPISNNIPRFDRDYAVLSIAPTPDPVPHLIFENKALPQGSSLFILGYYALTNKTDREDLLLRWGDSPGCTAVFENHCIFHGCQAVEGMSGAPIFLVANPLPQSGQVPESLTVIGLHLGTHNTDAREGLCTYIGGKVANTPNIGYRLPSIKFFLEAPTIAQEEK